MFENAKLDQILNSQANFFKMVFRVVLNWSNVVAPSSHFTT
jgi:hypothetical protein